MADWMRQSLYPSNTMSDELGPESLNIAVSGVLGCVTGVSTA